MFSRGIFTILAICTVFAGLTYYFFFYRPDMKDWSRIEKQARVFADASVIADMDHHLHLFLNCTHQQIAEEYAVRSCGTALESCEAYLSTFRDKTRVGEIEQHVWEFCEKGQCRGYLEWFPNGQHRDDALKRAEEDYWKSCKDQDMQEPCWAYLDNYPKGKHVSDSRLDPLRAAIAASHRIKPGSTVDTELDLERRMWKSQVTSLFDLPARADPDKLLVYLEDAQEPYIYHSGLSYDFPADARTMRVCYGEGDGNCLVLRPREAVIEIPLSSLTLKVERSLDLSWCKLNRNVLAESGHFSNASTDVMFGGLGVEAFVMPGVYILSCSVTGQRADARSGSVAYGFGDVSVDIHAPPVRSFIEVVYEHRGDDVTVRTSTRR